MAKVLIEFQVDAKGGVETINKVKGALEGVGVGGKVVEDSLSKADRQFATLINRLEPARVAAEKLARQQNLLAYGLDQGKLSAERYHAAMKTLEDQSQKTTGGFQNLTRGIGQLAVALGGALTLTQMVRSLVEGTKAAMEQERALTQLSNIVNEFGGNGATAAAQTQALAENLMRLGIENDETIKGVRDMVVATGDYAQSLTAVSLATDVYLKTGIPVARTLDLIKQLMEGHVKNIQNATREWGLHATATTTAQEALTKLQTTYQGYGATVDDALAKTQSFSANIKELWQTIGSWLIPVVSGATDVFKVLWAAIQAIALSLGQFVTGIIAAASALHQLVSGDPTGALKTMKDWLEQSKKDWASWGDRVVSTVVETGEALKNPAKLMVDPLVTAAAAAEEAVKKLKDQLKETDKLINQMAGSAERRGGGAIYGANYFTMGELAYDLERQMTGLAETGGIKFGLVMGRAAEPGIEAGIEEAITRSIVMSEEMARHFADAFKDGFLTIFQGGDFKDAWVGLWTGLAGMAAEAFGGVFSSLMSGSTISQGLQGTGLLTGGIGPTGPEQQKINWGGVAMLGGGLLASYGVAKQNKWVAATGGAMSGAGMGAAIGSVIPAIGTVVGAIIGGILGAVVGYFSSGGPKTYGYDINMAQKTGGIPWLRMGGGTGAVQEQEMARQLMDRQQQVTSTIHNLLRDMNVTFDKLPPILAAWKGDTGDLNAVFQAILKGELPRAVLAAYKDLLVQGLTGLGVSGGRAGQLMGAFATGDFDKAMASLQAYVEALMRLQSISKDLAKDLDTLSGELTRTVREAWLETMRDTLEQIGDLSEGLDKLTSDEQVARAQEIADLAESQYEANLQYLQNLYQAQQEINDSWADMFLGFEEARAGTGGKESLGLFYQRQLETLRQQLTGAGSVEELQSIMQKMQKYGMALWNLNLSGGMAPWGEAGAGSQEWVENFLRDQQAAADLLFKQWADEVKAQNEALRLALEGITNALTGENGLQENIIRFREHLRDASDKLGVLTQSAEGAAIALEGLASAGGVEPGYSRSA